MNNNQNNHTDPSVPILPWIMWILGVSFYAFSYFLQVSPSVMKQELMSEFAINATAFGNLAAFFFYTYALMQIPVGMFFDRFGIRKTLTIAIFICVSGCLIFGISYSIVTANVGRILMGIGCAFAPIATLAIINTWFPKKYFALLAGLMLTLGMLGAVAGEAPLLLLMKGIGWRHSILSLAIVGIFLAVFVWIIVRNHPKTTESSMTSPFQGLTSILANQQSWLLSIYAGLMFVAIPGFAGLWGIPFLSQTYFFSQETSATIVSLIFIGFAIGSPFFGWLSDYIHRRKLPMYIGTIGVLITMIVVISVPELSKITLSILMLLIGIFSSGFTTALATIKEVNHPESSATALGLMNLFNTLLGVAPQPVIGFMLDYLSAGEKHPNTQIFSAQQYHIALLILPTAFFVALLILPFIKETYCQQKGI